MKFLQLFVVTSVLAVGLWWAAAWAADAPPSAAPETRTPASSETQAPAAKPLVPPFLDAAPLAVETVKYDWVDAGRERKVPVKIYYPKAGQGPYPVIIFSHGLGGSRDGYEYLGRYWASYGYVSVHVQHLGSDATVWQGVTRPLRAMQDAAVDPRNALNRPLDVRFAIDQMTKLNAEEGPFKGRLDLGRVGVAGHSFGAYTTLAVAGEAFITPEGKELSLTDPRVKAAIAMSSPVLGTDLPIFDLQYGKIRIPIFHMTGTKDDSPLAKTQAKDRRVPYDHSKGAERYLVTFDGADHMTFSNNERVEPDENDTEYKRLIRIASIAFWEAYLKGDAKAKAWLAGGGYAEVLGNQGKLEHKTPRTAEDRAGKEAGSVFGLPTETTKMPTAPVIP